MALIPKYLDYLGIQRAYSAHTLKAYENDLSHFAQFLGQAPTLPLLKEQTIRDFRAWLAQRVVEGKSARSNARALSALRGFYKFVE